MLSPEEVGRMCNYDLLPCCGAHKHLRVPLCVLYKQIDDGEFELINYKGQQYVMQPPLHILAVRKSGGVGVVQRVRGIPAKEISPPPGER